MSRALLVTVVMGRARALSRAKAGIGEGLPLDNYSIALCGLPGFAVFTLRVLDARLIKGSDSLVPCPNACCAYYLSKTTPAMPNHSQSGGRKRKLVYIPIIHTVADMGTLGASIRGMKLSSLGRQGLTRNTAMVEKMWEEIESVAAHQPVTPGTVRVYQDGLPVCGHELEIVLELAGAGSRNHRLLLKLQARGATLMGTESPELLVEEYQLAAAAFASGATVRTEIRQKRLRDMLLEKRDRYIADRIDRTLCAGESGILLMGMLHDVKRYLDPNIDVVYPLGPPRMR